MTKGRVGLRTPRKTQQAKQYELVDSEKMKIAEVKIKHTTNNLISVRKNYQFEKNVQKRTCCHAKKIKLF